MCKLRRKLLLFDYSINKLVEWENSCNPSFTTDECLLSFSGIRLMKCLYSICLITASNARNIEQTLFPVFDNFVAYENGPVENDAYNNRAFLLGYTYEHKRMYKNDSYKPEFEYNYRLSENMYNENDDILLTLIEKEGIDNYRIMIDNAITTLKNHRNFPFESTEELVKLTHLELWKEACMTSARKLDITNWGKLQSELNNFVAMIQ